MRRHGPRTRGFLYLLAHEDAVKLGFSEKPQVRAGQIATSIGADADEVTTLAVVPATYGDELALHARFRDERVPDYTYPYRPHPRAGKEWYPAAMSKRLVLAMLNVARSAKRAA